jgi:hypothetical protein
VQGGTGSDVVTCAGTTLAGRPCRRRPLAGAAYCADHEPVEAPEVDLESIEVEPSDLARRIDATKRLVALHKQRHAKLIVAAQENSDVNPEGVAVLAHINRLELQLAALEAAERIRVLIVRRHAARS